MLTEKWIYEDVKVVSLEKEMKQVGKRLKQARSEKKD